MSGENVDLIRRLYEASAEAFATGELDLLDESLYDPTVQWHDAAEQPDGQVYHGFEGVKSAMRAFLDAWSEYSCEIEEIIEAGPERVLVLTHEHGRGKSSGLEIDQRGAHVWKLRAGKVVEFRAYWDRNRARQVAGEHELGRRA